MIVARIDKRSCLYESNNCPQIIACCRSVQWSFSMITPCVNICPTGHQTLNNERVSVCRRSMQRCKTLIILCINMRSLEYQQVNKKRIIIARRNIKRGLALPQFAGINNCPSINKKPGNV